MPRTKKVIEDSIDGGVEGVEVESVVLSEEEIEAKIHTDARDARVVKVKANIETARLARLELEKKGITETEGAKLDREVREEKELEEADKLYRFEPIELIEPEFGNGDDNILRLKINELIKVNNKRDNEII